MELLWFGEEESRGREQFDEMHEPMSARALPQHGLCDGWCFGGKRLIEQGAAERQHVGSSAVGEEAEIADARKASWQTFHFGKRRGLRCFVFQTIFPTKRGNMPLLV